MLQEGTVINPPTSQTDTYNLVSGAQITMDSYSAVSDENGEFCLESNPNGENSEIVKISASKDEIHRALVFSITVTIFAISIWLTIFHQVMKQV